MKTTFQKILNNESLKFIGKTLFYSFIVIALIFIITRISMEEPSFITSFKEAAIHGKSN